MRLVHEQNLAPLVLRPALVFLSELDSRVDVFLFKWILDSSYSATQTGFIEPTTNCSCRELQVEFMFDDSGRRERSRLGELNNRLIGLRVRDWWTATSRLIFEVSLLFKLSDPVLDCPWHTAR